MSTIVTKYNRFIESTSVSSHYKDITIKYGSIGNYIENIFDSLSDATLKEHISTILGEFIKTDKKQVNRYNIDDIVLIEYWYDSHIVPVKILEKQGKKYLISYNTDDSKIKNAPNEWIMSDRIIDHYHPKPTTNVVNPSIRISNAISIMKAYDQALLLDRIEKTISEYNMQENMNNTNTNKLTNSKQEVTYIGQSGLNVFLKILNAMPVNVDTLINNIQKAPESTYMVFIQTDILNTNRLKTIMSRFKSFNEIYDILKDEVNIRAYYGLNKEDKLNLEYGYIVGNEIITLGSFPFNRNNFISISDKDDKYVNYLLTYLEGLSLDDLKLFSKISTKITNFSFGFYKTKTKPSIEKGLLCFSYTGYGVWKDGLISTNSLNTFKTELRKFISKNNMSDKILFQVVPRDFTLHIKFKIK